MGYLLPIKNAYYKDCTTKLYHMFFQITSLQTYGTPSTLTSMTRSTSSPPLSACCSPGSSTAGCAASSCTPSRPRPSTATSLSSRPCPGRASMSCRWTTRPSPTWISARLPSRWWVDGAHLCFFFCQSFMQNFASSTL